MDRLNFNHLYYFYLVAKEGSVKAACEKAFVSQPTISDQLKLLEEHFSCQLFERRNRALFLTKEGELCLEYCEKIFDQANELTSRLKHKIRIPKDSIDVGISSHMSHYLQYDYLLPFFKDQNNQMNFIENQKHLLFAELEEENLDMVICMDKSSMLSSMESFKIGESKTYVVAHKKYRKYKKSFPESLNEIEYFSYTNNHFLKYEIDLYFTKNSLAPKVIGHADDLELMQLICEKGMAFTIIPEVAMKRFCQNKELIVLGEIKELQTIIWGVCKKDKSLKSFF